MIIYIWGIFMTLVFGPLAYLHGSKLDLHGTDEGPVVWTALCGFLALGAWPGIILGVYEMSFAAFIAFFMLLVCLLAGILGTILLICSVWMDDLDIIPFPVNNKVRMLVTGIPILLVIVMPASALGNITIFLGSFLIATWAFLDSEMEFSDIMKFLRIQ